MHSCRLMLQIIMTTKLGMEVNLSPIMRRCFEAKRSVRNALKSPQLL